MYIHVGPTAHRCPPKSRVPLALVVAVKVMSTSGDAWGAAAAAPEEDEADDVA